jgi:hypothetical protein
MIYRALFCSLVLLAAAVPALAGDDVPEWLRTAAAQRLDTYGKTVPAVVLVDNSEMTVQSDGTVLTTSTFAVRVLQNEGKHEAIATVPYLTDSGKVKEISAWLIRPSGTVRKFGKNDTLDVSESSDDVYNESRMKVISAVDEAESGAVFGYQVVAEEKPLFHQNQWYFQSLLPSVSSRLTLNLPTGWRANGVTFNYPEIKPVVSGATYTWEARNLAPIDPEQNGPNFHSIVPRLSISYGPEAGASSTGSYTSWGDVSRWYTDLAAPQMNLNDEIATKARELTANAKTELEKIQAIGKYVQNIKYISIQIGIGRFRPHQASQVFAKSYGDCKDKANLMRTMLQALHITAYPVLIYSGDRTYVRAEWVSPSQFNHCIVAIKVSDDTVTPTVVSHPALGRLMIFDPTDSETPVGDLPDHEQGSWALVAAGPDGSLVQMPMTPPESNRIDRVSSVDLDGNGAIRSVVSQTSIGQAAVRDRTRLKYLSKPEYASMIESWITRGATGAKLNKLDSVDEAGNGKFKLDVEFTVANYAQVMGGHLLVFKPAIISRGEGLSFGNTFRKYPINLSSQAFAETVNITLPQGFEVDELPDPLKLDTPFGSYSATYEVKDGKLTFTRKLLQKGGTIPVDKYPAVRDFYARIRATETAPVVLAKK